MLKIKALTAVQWKKSVHTPLPDQIICLTACITTKGMITMVYHLMNVHWHNIY